MSLLWQICQVLELYKLVGISLTTKNNKIISILVDLEFLTLDVWSILNLNQLDEEPLMSSFLLKKY